MVRRVVLYRDDTSARYRPDSKRPRAGTARRRHPGRWKDLTGSDKRRPHCGWPVRSCCITMISIRSAVQTRAAPKRRGVGLRAQSGVEAGTARRGAECQPALPAAERSGSGAAASLDSLQGLDERESALYAARLCWYFQCGILPRFTPAVCRMATNRTACGSLRFYSAGSRTPFVRSRGVGAVICLCGFTSGLAVPLWRSRRGAGDAGGRGWRRGACASLSKRIGFVAFSAGSTLGATRPQTCAKESSTLWTLFTLRRGCVDAYTCRRPGTRKDLTGSDKRRPHCGWPVRSCCIAKIPIRSIVQTRSAPKR